MDKNTFSVSFIIQKGKLNSLGEAPIFARITINRQMSHISTRMTVKPELWSSQKGRPIGAENKVLADTLDRWKALIIGRYNEMFLRREKVTAEVLKSVVTCQDKKSTTTLLSLFDEHNESYRLLVGKTITHKTYTRYLLTRKRIAEFMKEQYKIKDIALSDINLKFITDLDIFLRTRYDIGNNYVEKFIQRFKTIYSGALDNGIVQTNPFANYKFHFDSVNRGFLTQSEVDKMMKKQMPSLRLEHIRDLFIFSCYTGLAYVDVAALTTKHIIVGDDGNKWISTQRAKTSTPVNVMLLDIPLAIVDKYAGTRLGGKLFDVPSNQKVNDYLKEIADICGIDKRVTFHQVGTPLQQPSLSPTEYRLKRYRRCSATPTSVQHKSMLA